MMKVKMNFNTPFFNYFLKRSIAVLFLLIQLPLSAQWRQLGTDIDGDSVLDLSGAAVSLSSDSLIMAVGAPYNDGGGAESGQTRVYEFKDTNWVQMGSDIYGEAVGDLSGYSVSLSSNGLILAIGAIENDDNGQGSGHVRVFEYKDTAWVQMGADIDGKDIFDKFGWSVDLNPDGSILAVGANFSSANGSSSGQTSVFEYKDTAWVQLGSDIDGEATDDWSGRSVSLSSDGSILAIGAILNDGGGSNSGHVRVFEYVDTNWVQMGADIDGEAADDQFGSSVSLSDDGLILAAGASGNSANGSLSGHVRVYEYIDTSWVQIGANIDGESTNDRFGSSVSISSDGSVVAIGAWQGGTAGHVKVYEYLDSNWVQLYDNINGENSGDRLGVSVSLSSDGKYLVAGANSNDAGGNAAGHARGYYLCRTQSTLTIAACNSYTWTQTGSVYSASGVYKDTVMNAEGCDSIISLNLTINQPSSSTITLTTCDSYLWLQSGLTYTNSGVYRDTILNSVNCDSVISLDLTINKSSSSTSSVTACDSFLWMQTGVTYTMSGIYRDTIPNSVNCDSIISLDLIINQSSSSSSSLTACDSYLWPQTGVTYTMSGIYRDTITNSVNCDSVISLDLTINQSSSSSSSLTACDNYLWPQTGVTYTMSGIYRDTVPNAVNCDSVISLDLTINQSTSSISSIVACDNYLWSQTGVTYTMSGIYRDTVPNAVNCDSVISLDLTINSSNTGIDIIEACDSMVWIDGNTYTASNTTATHTLTNVLGCDSVVTLNLIINQSSSSTSSLTACDSYLWPQTGLTYTMSGIYRDTITNSVNCDSVISLDLTINQSSSSSSSLTACDSYLWPQTGLTYTMSGIYRDTVPNAVNCDSVISLDLTINQSTSSTSSVVACDNYLWLQTGLTYSTSGIYRDTILNSLNCDSVISLDLTINSSNTGIDIIEACDSIVWIDGNTYTASNTTATHTLTNVLGCDSVVTLNLTINQSSSSSSSLTACDNYLWPQTGVTYTMSGIYRDTVPNAVNCDSVISLDLTINQSTSSISSIVACDNYLWSQTGVTYTMSGIYRDTVPNAVNCDSVISLDLTINSSNTGIDIIEACDSMVWIDGNTYTASNTTATHTLTNVLGCDSVVTLNLIINQSSSSTSSLTACDSYLWPQTGLTYTMSGIYRDTITNSVNCDSVISLDLTINQSSSSSSSLTACDSYLWPQTGLTYTMSGIYRDTVPNAVNCDSVISLDLTINQSTSSTSSVVACDNYLWLQTGLTYSTSGIYRDTILNSLNCDSVISLDLTINSSNTGIDIIEACDSIVWIDGNTYTASNTTATHTLTNVLGCDSVVTLNLTINQSSSSSSSLTACDSYLWSQTGLTYTISGIYRDTVPNSVNCDSVISLDLIINYTDRDTLAIDTNPSFFWKGKKYFITAYASDTLQNSKGCDSISVLNLTITDTTITNTGDSLYFNQSSPSPTVTYQWVDCDSGYAIIPGATSRGFKPYKSGNYAVIITDGGVSDTSACIRTIITGINDYYSKASFRVYPNPTQNSFVIDFDKFRIYETLKIYDLVGNLVKEVYINSNRETIHISNLKSGIYFISYDREFLKLVVKN